MMTNPWIKFPLLLCVPSLCLGGSMIRAETSYPMVMCLRPVAVQIGKTSECDVVVRYNLYGAYKVFVTGNGVAATVDPPKTPLKPGVAKPQVDTLKVRFQVAADAVPGVRDVRIATPQGVSTLGQLVVVRDPVVREAANNDTRQTAQPITLPATLCGALEKPEDVDYFKFKAEAGKALTFHVLCQRLENRIHDLQEHADPILTLRDASGTVLAANDNYFAGDSLLHHRFAVSGEYSLEIRDTRYGGNPFWEYCIEVNDRPFVTCVHPLRVTPGKATRVRLNGYNLPPEPFATLQVPADTPDGPLWTVLALSADKSNAVPVFVSRLPDIAESETDHTTAAKAQKITVPCGISGRLGKEDQTDCYSFEAKAGERFTIGITAREQQSALDSLIRILNDKGDALIENDDHSERYIYTDSRIENWTAPAAGRYTIEVRDLHGRGGDNFVYFLQVARSQPHFTLETDTDKTLLAPGLASAIFVRATRHDGFAGDIQLGIEGLPAGVTGQCGRILSAGSDGCILVRAAADAKMTATNLRIFGTAATADGKGKLETTARPLQELYMPGGGRFHFPVQMHTLSIGEPMELKAVRITPTAISLKPGESKKIDITIERQPGFKGNVTLAAFYQHLDSVYGSSLPPGVSVDDSASQTLVTGEQTKGHITLKAAADAAPVEKQLVPIMAHVSINFVMKWTFCGEPLLITVEKPKSAK